MSTGKSEYVGTGNLMVEVSGTSVPFSMTEENVEGGVAFFGSSSSSDNEQALQR